MTTIVIPARGVRGLTGTTTGILEHTRRLTALGYRVILFGEKLDRERILQAGGAIHAIRRFPFGRNFRRDLFARRAERYLQSTRPDFVFGHGDVYRQDVLSLHDTLHALYESIHGHAMAKQTSAAAIHQRVLEGGQFRMMIANSQLMKDDISNRFGVPGEKINVIHPGYDPNKFGLEGKAGNRAEIRARLQVRDDQITVGIITSGSFEKRGVNIFLEALQKLDSEMQQRIVAVVIGKEKKTRQYIDDANQLALGSMLRFLPATPEVEKYFHALDVFVYPALLEEFGQSVQEAFVCGVPVITSRQVGAAELLGSHGKEMLMEKPTVEETARMLVRLIADADQRRKWGEIGVEAARHNTWDNNFGHTLEVFHQNGLGAP